MGNYDYSREERDAFGKVVELVAGKEETIKRASERPMCILCSDTGLNLDYAHRKIELCICKE